MMIRIIIVSVASYLSGEIIVVARLMLHILIPTSLLFPCFLPSLFLFLFGISGRVFNVGTYLVMLPCCYWAQN